MALIGVALSVVRGAILTLSRTTITVAGQRLAAGGRGPNP
jgi:hypothetical protein